MTTLKTSEEEAGSPGDTTKSRIGRIAIRLRSPEGDDVSALSTGERAALRRMDPSDPGPRWLELERLLTLCDVTPWDRDGEDEGTDALRWALAVNALALAEGRHDLRAPCGAGLAAAGLTELRVSALLSADADVLRDALPRLGRRLGSAGVACDWRPLVALALHTDRVPPDSANGRDLAEEARRQIAREYVRAMTERQIEETTT